MEASAYSPTRFEQRRRCPPSSSSEASYISDANSSSLHNVMMLQSFVGSWTLGPELFDAVGLKKIPLDHLGLELNARFAEAVDFAGLSSDPDSVATVLALAFLRLKETTERDAWEMLADKDLTWLKEQVDQHKDGLERIEKAIQAAERLF